MTTPSTTEVAQPVGEVDGAFLAEPGFGIFGGAVDLWAAAAGQRHHGGQRASAHEGPRHLNVLHVSEQGGGRPMKFAQL